MYLGAFFIIYFLAYRSPQQIAQSKMYGRGHMTINSVTTYSFENVHRDT